MKPLFLLLNAIAQMSPELEARLKKALKRVEFKKGEYISREGQVFNYIYFIEKGLVRIFHIDEVEVTTWFLIENDIFTSPEAFFRQMRANENIVALEDCICWGISRQELEEICDEFASFFKIRAWITEEYYLRDLRRRKELQLRNAVQRYASLAEGRPDLLYRVPVALLPSYLGVGLSTFHDARKKYLRNKRKEK